MSEIGIAVSKGNRAAACGQLPIFRPKKPGSLKGRFEALDALWRKRLVLRRTHRLSNCQFSYCRLCVQAVFAETGPDSICSQAGFTQLDL